MALAKKLGTLSREADQNDLVRTNPLPRPEYRRSHTVACSMAYCALCAQSVKPLIISTDPCEARNYRRISTYSFQDLILFRISTCTQIWKRAEAFRVRKGLIPISQYLAVNRKVFKMIFLRKSYRQPLWNDILAKKDRGVGGVLN